MPPTITPQEPTTSHNIQLLSWFNFFSAFKLYSAVAIIYFSTVTNSLALGISIFSIAQVSDALFEIPTGILSDRIGRKYTVFLGAVAKFISLLCYASGQSYFIFVIGAIFDGLSLAFHSGNNDALLYDTVSESGEKHKYHEYLGKANSMFYPALTVASLLGGFVASVSFPLVFWLSLIPQAICIAISLKMIEPKSHEKKLGNMYSHLKEAFRLLYTNIQLRRLSMAEIIKLSLEETAFQFQFLFYNTVWPVWAVGFTRSISALGNFVSFRYSGKVINKYSAIKLLIFNNIVSRVIHIAALTFPAITSPLLMSLTGFLYGITSVSKNKLLHEEFTDEQRATMYSIITFLGNILFGVVAIGIGMFADKLGAGRTLLIMQFAFIPIILLYLQVFRTHRKIHS
jgi:MFS family permease